jgi:uncharacterized membrane protein YecN with MAPEG domain
MTMPLWMLFAFALWTVLVLTATVGVYRWQRILAGSAGIKEFRYDNTAGQLDWYRRGMRAHGNCIENLPVFGALVLILTVLHVDTPALDVASGVFMVARVCQTSVHVAFVETNGTVSTRFSFFFVQILVVLWMSYIVVATAA